MKIEINKCNTRNEIVDSSYPNYTNCCNVNNSSVTIYKVMKK